MPDTHVNRSKAQSEEPESVIDICVCGHNEMDHGKIVARRWDDVNPCSRCDCPEFQKTDVKGKSPQ